MTKPWTPEETAKALAHVAWGHSYAEIGRRLGRSRSSIAGVVKRAKQRAERPEIRIKRPPVHFGANQERLTPILPAKYPFASDCSCPDFAHDDLHADAVTGARPAGFPVMPDRRRTA